MAEGGEVTLGGRARGPWRTAAVVCLLAASAGLGVRAWWSSPARSLPALPDLSRQPAAVAAHLVAADRAARTDPGPDTIGALGMAYHADSYHRRADACYALAQRSDPGDWRWRYYRILLQQDHSELGVLVDSLQALLATKDDLPLARFLLGQARFKQGHLDLAEQAFERAIDADRAHPLASQPPPGAPAHTRASVAAHASLGLARIALERHQVAGAEARLVRLIEGNPRFGPAHRILGRLYRQLGRERLARTHWLRSRRLPGYAPPADPMLDALALQSSHPTFLLKTAGVAGRGGDVAWHELLVRRAFDVGGLDPDATLEMGRLLLSKKRPREALGFFRQHLSLSSEDPVALEAIGQCHLDLGELGEAETALRRALERGSSESHSNLGLVLERQGRLAEAAAHYDKAVGLNPSSTVAHSGLGHLLARQGHLGRARRHLRAAVDPSPHRALRHLRPRPAPSSP